MTKRRKLAPLIEGDKKKKGGGSSASTTPKEYPNTLRAKSTARVLDLLCEGPIVGLVDDLKGVFFDGTPLVDVNDNVNFQGVVTHSRLGYPDQDHVPGFTSVENETAVTTEVTFGSPVSRSVSGSDLNAVRIKIGVPQLTESNATTGDLMGSSVSYTITITSDVGGQSQSITDTITGKTVSEYVRAYRCDLPGPSPWTITVTRNTADAVDLAVSNETYFASYSTIIDGKFRYPDSALVGIEVDAELFGGEIPTRGYLIDGLIIRVPSNYDPVAKTYSGMWDGTFDDALSDNPAWVLFDILTNKRYGLGIEDENIDLGAFYTVSQYCDEQIPDGFGGMEPRYTFNYPLATREDAYKVLQTVAASFRGMCFWSSGTVTVVADMPSDPVKLVSPANVIDGAFVYQGTSLRTRHSVTKVTWNDPEDQYRPAVEVVEDPIALQSLGFNEADLTMIGCTRRSEARRHGLWVLDTEATGTEIVTYRAAWDHADVVPGDVVEVADPSFAGVRFGGRILAATSTTVTLDDNPSLVGGGYIVGVTLADGTIVHKSVSGTSVVDGKLVLTVSSFAETPPVGAVWNLSGDVVPRQFRIVANRETDDGTFEISGLLHDPNKYDRVELGLVVGPPTYTRLDKTDTLTAPINLTVVQTNYMANNQARTRLTFSWSAPEDPLVMAYQVRYLEPGAIFTNAIDAAGLTFELDNVIFGDYTFDVRSVSADNRVSQWARIIHSSTGNDEPPGAPTDLAAVGILGGIDLTWVLPDDKDIKHTEVWRHTSNNRALVSEPVALIAGNAWSDLGMATATTYYYWVRCVDTSGNIGEFNAGATSGVSATSITPYDGTDTDTTPPDAPSSLTALGAFKQIWLTWNNPSDADTDKNNIYEATTSGGTKTLVGQVSASPSSKGAFVRGGLAAGLTRYYWVTAIDRSGNESGYSNMASATVASVDPGDLGTVTTLNAPTGLALGSSLALDTDGSQIVLLTATWNQYDITTDPTGVASYYELAVKEGAGTYIGYPIVIGSGTYTVRGVKANQAYTAQIRGVDRNGNRTSYSSEVTHTTLQDTTAPSAPSSFSAATGIGTIFLTWTNPSDADLAEVEVWEHTSNSSGSATRITTVNAVASAPGRFARTGLGTDVTRYFWLKARDYSGNVSAFSSGSGAATTAKVLAGDITVDSVLANSIVAGVTTTNVLNANVLQTTSSLPGTITVGSTGVTIATVETRAADPAARVNAYTTQINPGMVLISGGTSLASWRDGSDNTKISGGSIAANTVTANVVNIGLRGIEMMGLKFEHNMDGSGNVTANNLYWSSGTIGYINDSGSYTTAAIYSSPNTTFANTGVTAPTLVWSSGTMFVYWVKGETFLRVTTTSATAHGANNIILCTYRGGADKNAYYGRTVIDGDSIQTRAIQATHIAVGTITADLIGADQVNATHIAAGSIVADDIGTGSLIVDVAVGSSGKIHLDGTNNRIIISD